MQSMKMYKKGGVKNMQEYLITKVKKKRIKILSHELSPTVH